MVRLYPKGLQITNNHVSDLLQILFREKSVINPQHLVQIFPQTRWVSSRAVDLYRYNTQQNIVAVDEIFKLA